MTWQDWFSSCYLSVALVDYVFFAKRNNISLGELFLNSHRIFFIFFRYWVLPISVNWLVLTFFYRFKVTSNWPLSLEIVVAFLWIDFSYYVKHRLEHTYNIFWMAHRIHHSPVEYHGLISYRFSPWSVFHMLPFLALGAWVGLSPRVLISQLFIVGLWQNIAHLSFLEKASWFDRWAQTPFMHRFHHAREKEFVHCNFGGVLFLWDYIFKTYKAFEEKDRPTKIGLIKPLTILDNFIANYLWFWRAKGS